MSVPERENQAELIEAIQKDELAEYLLDADMSEILIDIIVEETGAPKMVVRVFFKLLSPWLAGLAKKGASTAGKLGLQEAHKRLSCFPYYKEIDTAFRNLKKKLDEGSERKKELDEILQGKRPVRDYKKIEGFSQELRVMLKTLDGQTDLSRQMEEGFSQVIALLKPQPPLHERIVQRNENNRLSYNAQALPFQARYEELNRLHGFLNAEKQFSWWLVVGSGGAGKSRVALEFCLRNRIAWRAGFLPQDKLGFDWHTWEPDSPTLIIVDYALAHVEAVGNMINALASREKSNPLVCPVRVLLLERGAENLLERLGAGSKKAIIDGSQFAEPLKVANLSPDDLWAIMLSVHPSLSDKDETLKNLQAIDLEGRPLFAIMAAEALAEKRDIRKWDRGQLLEYNLKREEQRWKEMGVTEKDKNLLAFATMVKGISLSDPIPQGLENYLPPVDEYYLTRQRFDQENTDFLAPLEPDIVGEFFVLQRLKNKGTQMAEAYRCAAWRTNKLFGFVSFLDLAAIDCPNDAILHSLLVPPEGTIILKKKWAMLAVNLIGTYGKVGNFDQAQRVYDKLSDLAANHAEESELRLVQATGAFNLIHSLCEAGKWGEAQRIYDKLSALAFEYEEESELRLLPAEGAVNLIYAYGKAGKCDEAQTTYGGLSDLAANHEEEPELRLLQAKGAVNLINYYGEAGKCDEAQTTYGGLSDLAANHKKEPELRLWQAKGAVNLISTYGKAGKCDEAQTTYYDELAALAVKHKEESEVRFVQAVGVVFLIHYLCEAEKWNEAQTTYGELSALAAEHKEESELRHEQTKGAFNLICYYGKAGRTDQAREIARSNHALFKSKGFYNFCVELAGKEHADSLLVLIEKLISGS